MMMMVMMMVVMVLVLVKESDGRMMTGWCDQTPHRPSPSASFPTIDRGGVNIVGGKEIILRNYSSKEFLYAGHNNSLNCVGRLKFQNHEFI